MDYQAERLSFARENISLDWGNAVFSKFCVVRGVRVWWAVEEYGPLQMSMARENTLENNIQRYVNVLQNFVSPLAKRIIYVQERNDVTKSNVVSEWFTNHPEIKCVTWPEQLQDVSPVASAWTNMENYVDRTYPLTIAEVKGAISNFWYEMKDHPDRFNDSFGFINKGLTKVIQNSGAFLY